MKIKSLIISLWLMILIMGCDRGHADLNVMTFNIRLDHPGDGQHNWLYRKEAAAELITALDVDIVGTQEVLQTQLDDLLRLLPGFGFVGVGREDGQTKGEYSAILYKTDRLEPESQGTFWLSDSPNEAGSVGWDAALERIVSWAIMREKTSGVRIAVFNTHFDHRGSIARLESSRLLVEQIRLIAGELPVILTGDFNANPDSEPIQVIVKSGFLADTRNLAREVRGPQWSFHGFGMSDPDSRQLIDFVFVSEGIGVSLHDNIFEEVGTTFHSDHNPIFVKLKVEKSRPQ
jgi:endonuclease/exonuclease/phosphatase family metal-dependent hydrolase